MKWWWKRIYKSGRKFGPLWGMVALAIFTSTICRPYSIRCASFTSVTLLLKMLAYRCSLLTYVLISLRSIELNYYIMKVNGTRWFDLSRASVQDDNLKSVEGLRIVSLQAVTDRNGRYGHLFYFPSFDIVMWRANCGTILCYYLLEQNGHAYRLRKSLQHVSILSFAKYSFCS